MSTAGRWFSALLTIAVIVGFGMQSMLSAEEGPEQQVIIGWRASLPAKERTTIQTRVLRNAGGRYGITLKYVRDLAAGGTVYKLSRTLPRKDLDALIRTLTADANVEYAEPDGVMQPMPSTQ